jgi:glycosyltransferase involved in cell wall biosynthesis
MRVLVDGLSVRAPSGEHVLLGHLRQLARWTEGQHQFLLLHDRSQTDWIRNLPPNVQPMCVSQPLGHWSRRIVWQAIALPRLLKQWQVDLVFTTSGTVLPRCRLPQVALAQNPWCLVPEIHHGLGQRQKAALQRRAYRQAMRKAAIMVYNSHYMRDAYRRNAGGGVERASEIAYQAIDDEAHELARSACTAVEKQPRLILSVSVMAAWKGVDVVVDALGCLHRRGCRATLRLVGPWPDAAYKAFVREKIARQGLDEYVTVTGKVPRSELYRHYAEARVFCLMSRCESFGIPALEAQVFGTPVVGSSTCATPEICGSGGVYGPPNDAGQTAILLEELLENADAWERVSRRARENAARFRWEVCSQPLLKMFAVTSPR